MRKFIVALLLLFFCSSQSDAEPSLKLTVLYDSEHRFGERAPALTSISEFLGHYDVEQSSLKADEWKPGSLASADIVVFLGLQEGVLDKDMIAEAASADRVMWIESGIEQLAALKGWGDFSSGGRVGGWSTVSYRSLARPMPDWMRCYVTNPGDGAEVFSTVSDGIDTVPLAWRRDNVYYIGAMDFYEPYLMAAFVDFIGRVIPPEYRLMPELARHAIIRIEDVSPLVRADAVRSVIEEIEGHGIPYAIAVIPIGIAGRDHLTMRDNPELLALLQQAQANGASIIMHGYTHQNEFSPKTGEGWEFWNARDDSPMEDDEAFTRDRLEKAFIELAHNGLYPVAFEPPHYAMSKKGYEVLSEYFDVFSGMPQISDESDSISLTLPFVVKSPWLNGMIIIPENMGYYDGHENTAEMMLENSQSLLDIEDSFAGFFYHGYISSEKVSEVIEGVQRQGYTFLDLRSLGMRSGSSLVKIEADGDGELYVQIDPALIEQWRIEDSTPPKGVVIEKFVRGQAVALAFIILVFISLIWRLRHNAHKKYEA